MKMKLSLTKKQKTFIDTKESEVLFGGAAGGGKSYGQVADALLYSIFMSSSLPQYQKDMIGERIEELREELKSYEKVEN